MSDPEMSTAVPEMSTPQGLVTRKCHVCPATFSYENGRTKIDEAFAIELASWTTLLGEVTQPVMDDLGEKVIGFRILPDVKQFCSFECLSDHINPLIAEYHAAEDRALAKMADERKRREADEQKRRDNWPARYGTPDLSSWERSAQAIGEPNVSL